MALASTCFIHAQDYQDICATPDPTEPENNNSNYSFSTDPAVLLAMDPTVVNVYFWSVLNSAGQTPNPLTEEEVLAAVQYMNISFNPYGIYFKYRGLDTFTSPAGLIWKRRHYGQPECCANYPFPSNNGEEICQNEIETMDPDGYLNISRCQLYSFWSDASAAQAYRNDGLNIYVPLSTEDFGGGAPSHGTNKLIVREAALLQNTLIHEIGHCFNLRHTWFDWWKKDQAYACQSQDACEHVTRDQQDGAFNAYQKGDFILDTAAMPDFKFEYCTLNCTGAGNCTGNGTDGFYYYDQGDCEYDGLLQNPPRDDCQGTPYDIDQVQSRNTMSYAPGDCRDNFTIGQAIRMKEAFFDKPALIPIVTTIASLYEPYKGDYYLAGPVPPTPNPPLFQPGFTYRFVECECDPSCPEPSPYEDTSFSYGGNAVLTILEDETDFSAITHPNHTAIQIDFVNPLPDSYGQNTRRCYDNWNRAAIDGSVTRFNDGVLNTNITILPQDSTAINDPALINTLDPGLYKIEKNYDDGATKQTIVVKENNE